MVKISYHVIEKVIMGKTVYQLKDNNDVLCSSEDYINVLSSVLHAVHNAIPVNITIHHFKVNSLKDFGDYLEIWGKLIQADIYINDKLCTESTKLKYYDKINDIISLVSLETMKYIYIYSDGNNRYVTADGTEYNYSVERGGKKEK